MKQTLSLISDYSLDDAVHALNSVLQDLRDELGDKRFENELFCKLLDVAGELYSESITRQQRAEGL